MSFDKIKAMRNAEKCLAQGKIRAAINEYKRVVEHDPKDFGTLNILGDLYLKNSEEKEAVGCFSQVADYYNSQGFAQKAIAVYNKISRLKPDSLEVSAKLAQLYKSKGSYAEARFHFKTLAEQYQQRGQKIEALAIWKQIADLDPQDSATYLKIAEVYWQEEQKEEAAKAFAEAGRRLSEQEQFESALAAYSRAMEISRYDLDILKGYANAQIKLGYGDEAAKILEEIIEKQPYNRDVLLLLIDCHIDSENPAEAEKAIIKLVEQEPANYPKFLELVKIHLKEKDLDAAARILSMSSEHLLVGGQSAEFLEFVNEILANNPEHLEALRLSVRYYGWHREEGELKSSLERLAEVARLNESVEDEHYALSQLVMIAPHEISYAQRLQELKIQYGVQENEYTNNLQPVKEEVPQFDSFAIIEDAVEAKAEDVLSHEFGIIDSNIADLPDEKYFEFSSQISANGTNGYEHIEQTAVQEVRSEASVELKPADELKLASEIESVEFYIGQGYRELAEKTVGSLFEQYGNRLEIQELQAKVQQTFNSVPIVQNVQAVEQKAVAEVKEKVETKDILSDFRQELGLEEENETENTSDYETHYHTATAYREMGLMEEAIREFQYAINLVRADDGTRRFFQCANFLGLCFMEKSMPNLALVWYQRGFETPDLTDAEKHALNYEIANAYEIGGETEQAIRYFEKIYAENVDYRDVSRRLKNLKG